MPHTTEMRKEDLDELAQFMGLPVRSIEEVEEVGNQVTPYSDMDITEVVSFVEAYTRREHQRWRTAFNALADEETSTISRYYTILYYTILYYTMYCTVLYCTIITYNITLGATPRS